MIEILFGCLKVIVMKLNKLPLDIKTIADYVGGYLYDWDEFTDKDTGLNTECFDDIEIEAKIGNDKYLFYVDACIDYVGERDYLTENFGLGNQTFDMGISTTVKNVEINGLRIYKNIETSDDEWELSNEELVELEKLIN